MCVSQCQNIQMWDKAEPLWPQRPPLWASRWSVRRGPCGIALPYAVLTWTLMTLRKREETPLLPDHWTTSARCTHISSFPRYPSRTLNLRCGELPRLHLCDLAVSSGRAWYQCWCQWQAAVVNGLTRDFLSSSFHTRGGKEMKMWSGFSEDNIFDSALDESYILSDVKV